MPTSAKKKSRHTEAAPTTAKPLTRPRARPERVFAVPMKTLRVGAGKTQVDVSKASGLAQSEVSRIEGRESLDELQVTTIRRYVEAIGGTLDLVVTFPTGHRARLAGGGPKIAGAE